MSRQIINILPFLMSALKHRGSALEGCFAYKWGTFHHKTTKVTLYEVAILKAAYERGRLKRNP